VETYNKFKVKAWYFIQKKVDKKISSKKITIVHESTKK
jgi:hypothetical protein